MDEDKFKGNNEQANVIVESKEIKCKPSTSAIKCQKKDNTNSVSNAKSKRTSGLLSTFVRRSTKRKAKKSVTLLETLLSSSHNLNDIASNSTLGTCSGEGGLCPDPVPNPTGKNEDSVTALTLKASGENLHTTDSEQSVHSTTKTSTHFFRKLIKRNSSETVKKKSEPDITNSSSKVSVSKSRQSCKICHSDSSKEFSYYEHSPNNFFVPTSYINFGKPTLNVTLANGLEAVQELARRFQESENRLIQILGRYIKDTSFQKELIDVLSQHSKLQREAERRTSALANDMWMHQMEIGRAQERTLQETLNSLVKQNRQLQIDNEIMFRKHEKLVRKFRSFPEIGLKYKCMDNNSQIESVIRHNESLQRKLDAYVQQIADLESDLHVLKNENEGLEQQLRLSSSQISNLKTSIQRLKSDTELEIVTLNYELQKNKKHIRESMEAGDVLLEDLQTLTRQFKGLPISINLSKFKENGNCLADLIHISRSCINELSKEMLSLQTQISLKDKDIDTLQETNTKLQENLKKSATELDNMSKKFDEGSFQEATKIISEQKCKILESDLKAAQEKIENLKMKFELEKSAMVNASPQCENLSKQMTEKDQMIEHTKIYVSNITSENIALRNQVDTLNRALAESGAGDLVKELANCQEQLAYFQSQYYHILSEKQAYVNEIDNLRQEKRSLIEKLEATFKQFQNQLQELEQATKENLGLKSQVESEHQTVLSLQHERMKYLEEKNMLKTIFQHMKAEIARVQKLESAVADISKEASKLALIAEYNKQIGEKLKTEVHEKDQTILQLKTSVEKLNGIQIQNTKEKLSLCYELSEVCQMKEQLNNILSLEMQKNIALDDTKKEIVESASSQLKKYEELHRTERSALKDLARDYKILMVQKEELLKENGRLSTEMNTMREAYKEQINKCNNITNAKNETDGQIAELIAKEKDNISLVNSLHEKLNAEVNKYDSNTKQLEKLIRQASGKILYLRKEKEELTNTVKYLQNNIQKLHSDLNESRKNEKEVKDLFNKTVSEKAELKKQLTELVEEKEKLTNEVNYANGLCEKVLSDFESSIKSSVEKEEVFKKEIRESKCIIQNNSKEIEHLTETIFMKQGDIERLTIEINQLREKERKYYESLKMFESQTQELKDMEDKKQKLENEINNLRIEHDSAKKLLNDIRNELDLMQRELKRAVEQKEEDYLSYKKHLDEVMMKNEELMGMSKKEICELKLNLSDVSQKLENERAAYGTLSEIHKEVSAKFIKSIESVTEEKTVRQEMEGKLKETLQALDTMRTEKEDLQNQINILLDGLNDGKNRINTLTKEKGVTQCSLDDLQRKYNELLTKCVSLEHQIRGIELGISDESNTDASLKERLKQESKENHEVILALKENITKLQQQTTALEFQKSEMTLRLHEVQRKCETEQGLCEQLKKYAQGVTNNDSENEGGR
ncbi:hypothetical protein NQ315_004030 [Exocentrus adspersus]|uniref:Uncharacterized protein n=1 Tax=Exocentrus adspersus TaxID=1586481 RepID=A0AAV8W6M1_9CUCU|nr:hypothetical protein NQ315_004030 [Exocentrus adspersus]